MYWWDNVKNTSVKSVGSTYARLVGQHVRHHSAVRPLLTPAAFMFLLVDDELEQLNWFFSWRVRFLSGRLARRKCNVNFQKLFSFIVFWIVYVDIQAKSLQNWHYVPQEPSSHRAQCLQCSLFVWHLQTPSKGGLHNDWMSFMQLGLLPTMCHVSRGKGLDVLSNPSHEVLHDFVEPFLISSQFLTVFIVWLFLSPFSAVYHSCSTECLTFVSKPASKLLTISWKIHCTRLHRSSF